MKIKTIIIFLIPLLLVASFVLANSFNSKKIPIVVENNQADIPPILNDQVLISDINLNTENQGVITNDSLIVKKNTDIEKQQPLPNPPKIIKAIYSTSWSASSTKKVDYFIDLITNTELNAIVVDIKDFSGLILYDTEDANIKSFKNTEVRISKINSLIKKFHDAGIYIIARLTVFQDPILAENRNNLALKNITNFTQENIAQAPLWEDRKGLSWIDPAAKEAWDYDIALAKNALDRGFDEVNFDYIRFASDGNLKSIGFPFYKKELQAKHEVLKEFFVYLRNQLPEAKISADLFGLTTVNNDDLGIGQKLEDALISFDAVAPMVYPSHFATGFNGYKNPAVYPYEIVKYSMIKALAKAEALKNLPENVDNEYIKIRPWLQDFDLGATYDTQKVKDQIRATEEVLANTPYYGGWMLWDPRNVYTKTALKSE